MKTVLLGGLLLLLPFLSDAQTTLTPDTTGGKNYRILLKDGSQLQGRIVRRDSITIGIRLPNGRITYVEPALFDRIETGAAAAGSRAPEATALVDTTRGKNYYLYLRDGSVLHGRLVQQTDTLDVVRLRNGQLTYVEPALIDHIQGKADRVDQAESVRQTSAADNPLAPYMTLGQTAYTPDAGHLYYRNVYLVYNELAYGITKFWSVGAAVVPVSWFVTDQGFAQSFNLSSKISFPLGRLVRIGADVAYRPAHGADYERQTALWNWEVLGTVGDRDRNITIGYGRESSRNFSFTRFPYLRIGAVQRLSRSVVFITDNTIYINEGVFSNASSVFSAVVRLGHRRHGFDLGVAGATFHTYYYSIPIYDNGYYSSTYIKTKQIGIIPYVGYTVRIGK